jgi:small acid-soluble spore protein A (major alpha-type SASP)
MAKGSAQIGKKVVPEAHKALDNMKYEIAAELGIPVYQGSEDYWGHVTSRDCGAVGGHMVRRMIEMAERSLVEKEGTY